MTEAVNGMLDNARSGRQTVQKDNDQALLHRLGPVFGEAMLMKKVPNMQIATYMALSIFAAKGSLDDGVLSAFMEQIVHGWTTETMRPGLVCLSILAHHRSAKQMSGKVTKALMKVPNLGTTLVDIGRQQRVDKLANGLCIALVERLCKKGDPRGLPVIRAVLTGQVIRDKQVAVVFKSLVLAAHRLNDETDPEGKIRKELGSTLIDLSRHTGDSSDIIRTVIEEGELDIEELEMKLDVSIRQQKVLAAEDVEMDGDGAAKSPQKDVHALLEQQSTQKLSLPTCLSANPGSASEGLTQLFLQVVAQSAEQPTLLETFVQLPALRRQDAANDSTFVAFFTHIWCGPYPTLARAAALDVVKKRLQEEDMKGKDFQVMLPYGLVALLDSSRKVRRVAADLLAQLGTMLSNQSGDKKKQDLWAGGVFFPEGTDLPQAEGEAVSRLLAGVMLPTLEECVMHEEHLGTLLQSSLESSGKKSDGSGKRVLSQSNRQSVFAWLAAHITATPLLRVKSSLLSVLNRIRGVGSVSRTKLLLPAFRWWAALTAEEVAALCQNEQVSSERLHERFAETVVANDSNGLDFLLSVIQDAKSAQRPELVRSSFRRIRNMWPSMKLDTKSDVSRTMLELYQQQQSQPQNEQQKPSEDDQDVQEIIATEASDLLKNVELTTDILAHFLSSIQVRTKTATESPPSKRRRTSPSNADRGTQVYTAAELNKILRDITFVLQLVEGSNPRAHPELLHSLFDTLGELQRFSSVVGSELGYLQNLVLTSLIAMVPEYKDKTNKKLEIGSSGGYGDLLANCIQKTTSPIVQNSALLLIASLASAAPDVVLHSVMPIFTFMGASVLRQNDDYSAHVVNQTVKEVIPPLMESLRKGKRNPIAGATELLGSFVTAYEHIPSHRKQDLFVSLVNTLGPAEFLFALIAMLVDKYEANANITSFAVDLLSVYSAEVQLQTAAQLLALISDIFKPRPELSSTLLGVGDDVRDKKDVHKTALRQLTVFPSLLSSKKMKKEIEELAEQDDMQTSKMRELYATLFKDTLALADVVKGEKDLHECCGSALANLLNLLSIGEFIKSVENLLDKTEMDLRRKVLRALEVRVDQEGTGDAASRTALLGFLPQLTAAIRDTEDLRYKRTAVSSVDKIAEKYGKKDLEAVAAAATTIAGPECLGQPDAGLRVMALLCLASLVDVLQDGILPVLSLAVPQAILYIEQSLDFGEEPHGELHNAGYAFITAVAQHLPYMVTGAYLDKILTASSASAAAADLDNEARDSRLNCLRFLARTVDPKVFFAGLEKNWAAATEAGYEAIGELVDILSVAINSHSKSVIGKNLGSLSSVFLNALDLRREMQAKGELLTRELEKIAEVETQLNEAALKMIYKLNDAAFRPVFTQVVEWPSRLGKKDTAGRVARRYSVYKFLDKFFDSLKSIVTSYATYILEDAVATLEGCDMGVAEQRQLWDAVLRTLGRCFEHDQDEFWQAPSHFGGVAGVLTSQLGRADAEAGVDVRESLIPALVELAAAADSQDHQKEINTAVLKQLRAERAAVRLAAVQCQQALTDRLGEEWLASLPEMLPYISELQDDDDEVVERETHRWIVKIEGVLGESLDSMLQ
ncbi:hypothetical protein ACRALDRAFT_1076262 [Sodiomyces alcalophilus JCM 7366]|uniref:uncharacterized protein n=1 Tax=Sodiomyces alcalophilus JCM 7366 TaxID=591952 RepID=UPI0039B54D2F